MTFFEMLSALLIGPLKLGFEIIYSIANRVIGHPGTSVVVLSLVMNILVLPLYRQADAMQNRARDVENKLAKGIAHIKKTFSGDERMMILQTYYKQNHYSPLSALSGSVSLLLEIPFFMAAYQFLSGLEILQGVSFGPIKDLSAPDGLIVIGGVAINLLPILMTLVNVISSALYLKGFPLKTKIQLYAMAGFFLVFLYTSPSALVFYWTLNNVFSLVKTIFYKIKNPTKVLSVLLSVLGIVGLVFGLFFYDVGFIKRRLFLIALSLALQFPLVWPKLRGTFRSKLPARQKAPVAPNKKLFFMGTVFLTVLVGLLIPTTFIAASPQEYVDITYFTHPLWYVVSTFCLAAGTFLVWLRVFYMLANDKGKVIFEKLIFIAGVMMLVNYMFFGLNLGNISSSLRYDKGMQFTGTEILVNWLVIAAVIALAYLVISKWRRAVVSILLVASIALSGMSGLHIATIKSSVDDIYVTQLESDEAAPTFTLSKTGNNVVVIMLDRAIGAYMPYMMKEKPELKQQYEGFTYYNNTISYGGSTNIAAPALLGGYEYTPVELNKRKDESLKDKHNESLKVLPQLFSQNGYAVTVADPPYANYAWIPDLSIYNGMDNVKAYITEGMFDSTAGKAAAVAGNKRNFFCFGLMKTMPLYVQPTLYDEGRYNHMAPDKEGQVTADTQENQSQYAGLNPTFMASYNVLENMPNITNFSEDDKNTYLFLCNNTVHEPTILQTPDYVPAETVDNTAYDAAHADRFTVDGQQLDMSEERCYAQYHSNMAALLRIGEWLDYLREEGVYDNTRIIIVSDHGYEQQVDALSYEEDGYTMSVQPVFPLLMVKDFNSEGELVTSDEFMTNADVPTLAVQGLIENPVNPYTGVAITSDAKTAHRQYIMQHAGREWDVTVNNGNVLMPTYWMSVGDNIWDGDDWEYITNSVALDEHKSPPDKKPGKKPGKESGE